MNDNELISCNNAFLAQNTEYIRKFRGFDKLLMSNYLLPAFVLDNAQRPDNASVGDCSLQQMKIRMRYKQAHKK